MENISINFLVNELKKAFPEGCPISRISLRKTFLEWRLGKRSLVFSLLPRSAPFFLSENRAPGTPIASADINVLRKYLENGRLTTIEKPLDERMIIFTVEKTAIWGDRTGIRFIVNAGRIPTSWIITDSDGKVLWSWNESSAIAGTTYLQPEDDRLPLQDLTAADIRSAEKPKDLYSRFRGLGPAMCRELMAAEDTKSILEKLLAAEPDGGYSYLKEDYPLEMSSLGTPLQAYPSLSTAIEARQIQGREQARFEQRRHHLLKRVLRDIDRKQTLLTKLQAERNSCDKAERMIHHAELLSANFTAIRRGMDSIILDDLLTGEPVEIRLDPDQAPSEIISRMYGKAARMKRKAPKVDQRIRNVRSELAALADEQYALQQAASMGDLPEKQTKKQTKDKKAGELAGVLRINLPDGFFIYVGKNNQGNQVLYNRKLGPDDLWFHAKDIPGSHVILKNPGGKKIPEAMIEQAAALAAYHSRDGKNTRVEVQYTNKANLYSSKGKGQGFVLLRKFKALYVEPKSPEEFINETPS